MSHITCSVWWARPAALPPRTDLLDANERRKASEFARPDDSQRYVTAHALVRLLLAAKIGLPAAELRFERTCRRCGGDHGKPRLIHPDRSVPSMVAFNLSHAGDRVVVAVVDGDHLAVGVDVERVPRPNEPVVATAGTGMLTPTELATYRRLHPARRAHALAVWWTRKEAVLKATGHGLAVAPSAIEMTAPDRAPALTRWGAGDDLERFFGETPPRRGWRDNGSPLALRDLRAGRGYAGCLAVLGVGSVVVTEHDADDLLGAG